MGKNWVSFVILDFVVTMIINKTKGSENPGFTEYNMENIIEHVKMIWADNSYLFQAPIGPNFPSHDPCILCSV